MRRPLRIGIAGTHSTGKSTFIAAVTAAAENRGLRVGRIGDLARRARDLGFPILADHTAESTLWIMAECLRQQAEASLGCDVILVDRPAVDALGYLEAAIEITGRVIEPDDLTGLAAIARVDCGRYDMLVATVLDPGIALGEGRDKDARFRVAAGRRVSALCTRLAPAFVEMRSADGERVTEQAVAMMRDDPENRQSVTDDATASPSEE